MSITSVLKCNNCNLVVNELLTFVQHKHEVMDSESLVRICTSAFTAEDIETAKSLFFQSVSSDVRKIKRKKKEGKSNKDLFDVIGMFKSLDPETIPIFVAHDLNKLPPVTFDHVDVTRLLKDIVVLQNEVKMIKNTYVTTDALLQTKEEFFMKNCEGRMNNGFQINPNSTLNKTSRHINIKRGACVGSFDCNSGPIGLPHISCIENDSNNGTIDTQNISCELLSPSRVRERGADESAVAVSRPAQEHVEAPTAVSTVRPTVVPPILPYAPPSPPPVPVNVADLLTKRSFANVVSALGDWKEPKKSSEWTEVQRNRHRNRFIGKKGIAITSSECKFKAADCKIPLFINNVDKGTSSKDIADYIKDKTQVTVTLEKIEMKQQRDYDAYKMLVPKHKLELFLEDRIWPEGITFRRFVDFRYRYYTNQYGLQSNKGNSN